ncbi:hypothetical protein ENSA5_64100 [Enhygromyxa salina]|uniref:Uncharacterized protein n=1 Tax=Enhygromyxa salina TaxID=215803 RepID=A0A2S9XCB4_9BACT|nr:hypothetical protein [Enhygromyxa salina]PRP90495.1 hypothetical protein ENSA5_64100 [Enhygromyxa salina]
MRLPVLPVALATVLVIPAVAEASPFAVPLTANDLNLLVHEPPASSSAPSMDGEDAPADDAPADDAPADDAPADDAPADDAPADAEPADATEDVPTGDEDAIDPTTGDPTEGEVLEDDELDDELSGPTKKGDFNANAIGLRGGIHLIPSYFLNAALASYSNSLCRNEVGSWGEQNGLVKVDGCNFYVGGDYIRRISRAFDISVGLGYLHIQPPDSLWLDNNEWDRDSCTTDEGPGSACNLGAADYTEIDLRMFTVEVNFIGRGTLYRNEDVEIQLGGGGGVGVGVLIGDGVRRSPLGSDPGSPNDPNSCQTLADTADFRKCTPRYYDDPGIDQDGDGMIGDVSREDVDAGAPLPNGSTIRGDSWADCGRDKCNGSDLNAFGTVEDDGTWPVYPLVNLLGSFRVIVKDSFGISIEGGIKNGFFFGGGIQYYFGGGGKDK